MTSTTKRKHSETFISKVLYDLCQKLLYKNQNENEEVFESIRQWLNSNKEDDNTFQAAITCQHWAYKETPLHLLLGRKPPLDIIQTIIRVAPKAVQMKNDVFILPIHYACCYGASFEVIQALVNAYPESVKAASKTGSLPFHKALYMDASLGVLNFLIESYPEGIGHKDDNGETPLDILKEKKYAEKLDDNRMLPLHHACKNGYSDHLIRLLAQAYPECINIKDNAGKTPLDYYERPLYDELTQIKSNINELKSEMVALKSEVKVELNAFKASVQSDTTEIKLEMKDELNAFKASVQSDMTEIRSEMKVELNAFKASIQSDMTEIKSMLSQFGAI